ncbi:hypothetical protein MKW98_019766 [Papaver atlanticum]|uniref:non-specific serine/threonine protein kinase n=1 Tax=Papaver atlanticum TaxID=357466 RepID=A0AAD4TCQ3_9MAGN|nr:hypothetical protein MKW98_019766 [Papaver atlanticum]
MFFIFFKILLVLLHLGLNSAEALGDVDFIYNGFKEAKDLVLDGMADITPKGLLRLTHIETKYGVGHAFYSNPVQFLNKNSTNSSAAATGAAAADRGNISTPLSFSTAFIFAIVSESEIYGQGMAFVIAPTRGLPGGLANQYLGIFNDTNNGNQKNHILAIEIDTNRNVEYDADNNHIGIDVNGLKSVKAKFAKYYTDLNGGYKNLSLSSGEPMQIWVDYDGVKKLLNVTIVPVHIPKPVVPLLSLSLDLSSVLLENMYVGFSSSTQTVKTFHYIHGWSFKVNGTAQELHVPSLPDHPRTFKKQEKIALSVLIPVVVLTLVAAAVIIYVWKKRYAELIEDWEDIYGTHRFAYKDLYKATNGFGEKDVIGNGAFGKVYRGVLPSTKIQVAIKKVSHDSTRGMQQFIAEIVSIGKLRHRNLVQLYGYCRRKGELLLVYDYMPNGSLDNFLFRRRSQNGSTTVRTMLDWCRRFQIIKGVASGLVYLHEEWEKVVIHRDIKSSNVLLDNEMNPRLGDFGLAMLFDHGTCDAPTSRVVGTPGYLAPEMTKSGMASTSTDVYAFGVFLLEVATGKRPVELNTAITGEGLIYLVDWALSNWRKGTMLETADRNLGGDYVVEQMELALRLGLLCTHTDPEHRPSMRRVMQYLSGDLTLQTKDLSALETSDTLNQAFTRRECPEDKQLFSAGNTKSIQSTPAESIPSSPV